MSVLYTILLEAKLNNYYRFAVHSAQFTDCYLKGLDGILAAYITQIFHGHRVIPGYVLQDLDEIRLV